MDNNMRKSKHRILQVLHSSYKARCSKDCLPQNKEQYFKLFLALLISVTVI